MKQIYCIVHGDKIVGVGETRNIKERLPNGYKWKIQSDLPDTSRVIQGLKDLADNLGRENVFEFSVIYLESVPEQEARAREDWWIRHLRTEGHPLLNQTGFKTKKD